MAGIIKSNSLDIPSREYYFNSVSPGLIKEVSMPAKQLFIAFGLVILFSTVSYADSIRIPIPPVPPVPDFVKDPPEVEFMAPPPPAFIKVEVSHPDYWFYDDDKEAWFYYEKGRKRRYVKRHEWRDDGKHFCVKSKKWVKVNKSHAGKKGWVKKHRVKETVKVKEKRWYRFWGD